MYALGEIFTTVDKMRGKKTGEKHWDADSSVSSLYCCNESCWFAEEVHNLLKGLVLFQYDKQAEKLQLGYEEALHTMEAALPEVWPEGLQNNQAPVTTTPEPTIISVKCPFHTWVRKYSISLHVFIVVIGLRCVDIFSEKTFMRNSAFSINLHQPSVYKVNINIPES